jgi:hypothetical protein
VFPPGLLSLLSPYVLTCNKGTNKMPVHFVKRGFVVYI